MTRMPMRCWWLGLLLAGLFVAAAAPTEAHGHPTAADAAADATPPRALREEHHHMYGGGAAAMRRLSAHFSPTSTSPRMSAQLPRNGFVGGPRSSLGKPSPSQSIPDRSGRAVAALLAHPCRRGDVAVSTGHLPVVCLAQWPAEGVYARLRAVMVASTHTGCGTSEGGCDLFTTDNS